MFLVLLELSWAEFKRYLAKENDLNKSSAEFIQLIKDCLDRVKEENWLKYYKHVEHLEDEHRAIDSIIDFNIEQVVDDFENYASDSDIEF